MKLYEITSAYQNIFNQIDETGEVNESFITQLETIQEDFEQKAILVASYIKNLEAEELAISNAIDEMKARKDKLSKKAESLSEYLQFNLQALSINEIKSSPYFKIRLKKCPASVDVFDDSIVPRQYWREKTTVVLSVDKIKVKELLSEGVEIPGCSIQHKIKLEIK